MRVGVLAGLHEVVQVEVARDERGGLAVRLVQGQRLIPLQVAHHLLEAQPWARSVFIFTVALPPSAGSRRPGAAAPPEPAGARRARR